MRGFRNNDEGYLKWIESHPAGFVVNVDVPQTRDEYPMVHSAQHKLLSSAAVGGYTTGDYEKICSDDMEELEEWAKETHGKRLRFCQSPVCAKALKEAALTDDEMDRLWS
jgi:hypothetical protein